MMPTSNWPTVTVVDRGVDLAAERRRQAAWFRWLATLPETRGMPAIGEAVIDPPEEPHD